MIIFSVAQKLYVKLYGHFELSSSDFGTVDSVRRRLTFSPDNVHSVFINGLGENILLFTNNAGVQFEFTISRGKNVMAIIELHPHGIYVNKQWRLNENVLTNRHLNDAMNIQPSRILNFEIGTIGKARFDIKFDKMEFAALLFTHRKLYSSRFNGDYAVKRFDDFISREDDRRPLNISRVKRFLESNREVKLAIVRDFISNWVRTKQAAQGDQLIQPDAIIEQFIREIGLGRRIQ